jgi:hypothetical protein
VGRKPSKNPLSTLISFRIDAETTKALDAELERLLSNQPGLLVGRGDMVRILLVEALTARAKKRAK